MVELINNHVLFPNGANWKDRPEWSRQWQNEVSGAVTGAETRTATRVQPRVSLSFTITPLNLVEQSQFDDRIRAGAKSGYACAPYHGRGAILSASAGDEITVRPGRTWTVGDYVFLRASDDSYEVRQVTAAVFAFELWALELDAPLVGEYSAGSLVWPLIFGEFSVAGMPARSAVTGPARLTIREMISPATATLGAVTPPGGDGIGVFAIGTTFEVQ